PGSAFCLYRGQKSPQNPLAVAILSKSRPLRFADCVPKNEIFQTVPWLIMKPVDSFDAAALARSLLRRRREGALATLMADSGAPYCSLVNLASQPDGAPILLISRLALHTQNILADPRVSLMLDERGPKDPLQGARIMVAGRASEATGEQAAILRRRYLAAHPAAEGFLKFKDFSIFAIAVRQVHLVAGFGRIIDLAPDQVLTDLTGAAALVA